LSTNLISIASVSTISTQAGRYILPEIASRLSLNTALETEFLDSLPTNNMPSTATAIAMTVGLAWNIILALITAMTLTLRMPVATGLTTTIAAATNVWLIIHSMGRENNKVNDDKRKDSV
jgi:hypothetical protein